MAIDIEEDRLIIATLGILMVMLAAMLLGGTTGQILFSYTIILFFGAYILIGVKSTAERHSWHPFAFTVGALVTVLSIVFAALWYFHHLNPSYTDPVYWLGFPRATAVVVYGLWMPPALLLMFTYPYLFDEYIWDSDEADKFAEIDTTRPNSDIAGGDD